jgi:hypothetical protein
MTESLALRFLLVPDAGAARRVRRPIAEQRAGTGVVADGLLDHPMLLADVE